MNAILGHKFAPSCDGATTPRVGGRALARMTVRRQAIRDRRNSSRLTEQNLNGQIHKMPALVLLGLQ